MFPILIWNPQDMLWSSAWYDWLCFLYFMIPKITYNKETFKDPKKFHLNESTRKVKN